MDGPGTNTYIYICIYIYILCILFTKFTNICFTNKTRFLRPSLVASPNLPAHVEPSWFGGFWQRPGYCISMEPDASRHGAIKHLTEVGKTKSASGTSLIGNTCNKITQQRTSLFAKSAPATQPFVPSSLTALLTLEAGWKPVAWQNPPCKHLANMSLAQFPQTSTNPIF